MEPSSPTTLSDRGYEPAAYPACIKRQDRVFNGQDGTMVPESMCGHLSCERVAKLVTPTYCAECPLRRVIPVEQITKLDPVISMRDFKQPKILANGTIVYERTGWEPPVTPAGYTPKSTDPRSDDAWVFLPLLPPCQDRKMVNTVRPCGCLNVIAMCESKTCEHAGQVVQAKNCTGCPHARLHQIEMQ